MARIDQYARLMHHRISTSGVRFTIPTSDDHTDETWLNTDLYIGELGINISDDTLFMRTNNGIIQISTGTSSGGSTASVANPWTFTSPNLSISSTYSVDAVQRNSSTFTDLGTTTLRWKDLYLGGSSNGYTTINTNAGLILKDNAANILTTYGAVTSNAPIEINTSSSNNAKDRIIHINSRNTTVQGGIGSKTAFIASNNITMSNPENTVAIGAGDMTFNSGVTSSVMIGYGYGKQNTTSRTVVAGGQFQIRGISDDGSNNYIDSDWKTTQARVTTSNATTTNIATIAWYDNVNGGEIIQIKAFIVGAEIVGSGIWYSAEVLATAVMDNGAVATMLGTPIINSETNDTLDCDIDCDSAGIYIKVSGKAATSIRWMCTYSYHRLVQLTA